MTFIKPSITRGGPGPASAAENTDTNDIWAIFRALRDSRSVFGLRPGHIQTLQAMLSFLRPGHGVTVFASNTEICRRVGGIDERTLRRHIERFATLGLLKRQDSPNGKRYRVRASGGECLSFGLSLAPLQDRAPEILAAAQDLEIARRDRIFLRKKILVRLAQLEEALPDHPLPSETRKALRRSLTVAEHHALLARAEAECRCMSTAVDAPETHSLPANDGQNARHHSRSEKEYKDMIKPADDTLPQIRTLTSVCNHATSFATDRLGCWEDVEDHARKLAPMIGINGNTLEQAISESGSRKTACAVFIILQLGERIRDFAAYFHSLTIGRRKQQFDPGALVMRLARPTGRIA